MAENGQGNAETEVGDRVGKALEGEPSEVQPCRGRNPGDEGANANGNQPGRDATVIHATEPVEKNDGKAGNADDRGNEHFQGRLHGNEGDRDTSKRAKQGCARSDSADDWRDEAAHHQDEALDKDPRQPCLPAFTGSPVLRVMGSIMTKV